MIVVFFAAAVSAGWFVRSMPWSEQPPRPAIGKPAPRIELVRLGDQRTLNELDGHPQDQVLLLHCWATWCAPCRMEYPHLLRLADEIGSQNGFQFVPVSCERVGGETFDGLWAKTKDYFDAQNIDGIAYADPRGVTRRSMAERLQRDALYFPTSILIDREGKIVGTWEGYTSETLEEIKSAVTRLVSRR